MYKRKKNVCFFLSLLSWMGTLGFLIITALCRSSGETNGFTKSLLDLFIPLTITYIMALVLLIFIREKMRNTVWVADIVLSTLYYGKIAMWITIGLYAVDEFIFIPLWKNYKLKYKINKEIDKRGI